ncbi:hypothetical protein [Shouchella tritolerans]|uniref:hypothetical protein n=1 Tax=Shouchella tritolerans TaxID=2979466 RepID=UPI000AAD91F8|nr:hypothetical protein [Shouchella tritolerans]
MANALKLLLVEFREMGMGRWIGIVATALLWGVLYSMLVVDIGPRIEKGVIAPGLGVVLFVMWLFFPVFFVRGEAYRIRDPYGKVAVPDIYVLLKMMPLKNSEKALNRMLSMSAFILVANAFLNVSIFASAFLIGHSPFWDVKAALAWVLLTWVSGLFWVACEPYARTYRHRDWLDFLAWLAPVVAVLSLVGWLTGLWFFGIVIYFLFQSPLVTLAVLLVLLVIQFFVTFKVVTAAFEKVDYYV